MKYYKGQFQLNKKTHLACCQFGGLDQETIFYKLDFNTKLHMIHNQKRAAEYTHRFKNRTHSYKYYSLENVYYGNDLEIKSNKDWHKYQKLLAFI